MVKWPSRCIALSMVTLRPPSYQWNITTPYNGQNVANSRYGFRLEFIQVGITFAVAHNI